MAKNKRLGDIAWENLFSKYEILSKIDKQNFFIIKASLIKEFREARLMAKFDYNRNLPAIFKENNLSILPTSRGSYIIGSFDAYFKIEQPERDVVEYIDPRTELQSIDFCNINNEATAINCAYIHNILADFTDEQDLLPTVCGKMSSGAFNFYINDKKDKTKTFTIKVDRSQVEIDGGFESSNSLILVEAKNAISDDFHIRQLYYPYRLWIDKIPKELKLVFMVYSNGIYTLFQYAFTEPLNYNSITLVKSKRYSLMPYEIDLDDIENLLRKTPTLPEPKCPFPQANLFERIINLCELLYDNTMLNHEEITTNYDFDKRQTDYYANAGIYLGFIKKVKNNGNIEFTLTETGKKLFETCYRERQLKFAESILKHSVFKKTLELYFRNLQPPTNSEIVQIMIYEKLFRVGSEKTFYRRASTIRKWIDWILSLRS